MTRRWRRRLARRAYLTVLVTLGVWLYVSTGLWMVVAAGVGGILVLTGLWKGRRRIGRARRVVRRVVPRRPVSARAAALERQATHLYFWWLDGVLLYIGVTNDADRRVDQHGAVKPWHVPGVVMELKATFPTRSAALAAEEAAIRQYRPRHNVVFNGRGTA